MIDFAVDEASVAEVTDYLEQTRKNILLGIVEGMGEAMEGLAWNVADKLTGNPIVSRSGELLGAVLRSPRVRQTSQAVFGSVSADVGAKHLGLWLEEGTHVPAVEGTLFHFTSSDGKSVFTHGHDAFQVAPKPFLNPSLDEYRGTIMDTIAARTGEAFV